MEEKNFKFTGIFFFIVGLLGLIGTVALFSKRTVLQQKAETTGNVAISLDPVTATKPQGEIFPVKIKIQAGSNIVTAMDIRLSFNKDKLEIVRFAPSASLPNSVYSNRASSLGGNDGLAKIGAFSMDQTVTGDIDAGTLYLKGKVVSDTPLSLTIEKTTSMVVGKAGTEVANFSVNQTVNGGYIIGAPTAAPILNFKIKFQGVSAKKADQKMKVIVKKESDSWDFNDVAVTADDNGIYSGTATLTGVPSGDKYTVFIKGPKHLARKFCTNNQASRCSSAGAITLTTGQNDFDFSKLVLEGGDLPDSGVQNGVINSVDYSLWKSRVGKSGADDLAIADINFDGAINAVDWLLMRTTLEAKYEEDY